MAIDYNQFGGSGKFVYLPKIGEEAEFKIKELRVVKDGNPKFHFVIKEEMELPSGGTAKVDKNLGYHIEAELEDGKILSVSSMSAFLQVFKKHNIQDGEWVRIKHIDRGEWKVEKIISREGGNEGDVAQN